MGTTKVGRDNTGGSGAIIVASSELVGCEANGGSAEVSNVAGEMSISRFLSKENMDELQIGLPLMP